jgi:hypothetical protein
VKQAALQGALVFTEQNATAEPVHNYLWSGMVRRSEWIILGFLVYAAALGALLPVTPSVRHLVIFLNAAMLAAYAVLIVVSRTKTALAFSVARDMASLALIVLAYREMGWFSGVRAPRTCALRSMITPTP